MLGEDPRRAGRAWRERIGIVLQSCRLDPYLTVAESLSLFAGYYQAPRPVEEVIVAVGLEGKADVRAGKLSGGQQRRLDVGMALVGDPELLFLDEPTTGFDPNARRQAWEAIAGLRDLGKTVFLTTHYMDEAQRLADRVAIIAGGEVVARGTPEDLGDREAAPTTIAYRRGGEDVSIETTTPVETLNELTGEALAAGLELESLEVRRPSLEDVYLELTEPDDGRAGGASREPPPAPAPLRPEGLLAQPGRGLLHGHVPGRPAADLRDDLRRQDDRRQRRRSRSPTYYVPAIITLAIVSATMQTLAMSLVIAREDGRLKRGRGTPMPAWVFIAGRIGNSIVVALIMLAVARRDRRALLRGLDPLGAGPGPARRARRSAPPRSAASGSR